MKSPYCVTVSGSKLNDCLDQIEKNPLVELRLDLIDLTKKERIILYQQAPNFIATCRIPNEDEVLFYLNEAIQGGANFIDVDIRRSIELIEKLRGSIENRNCKLIISFHDYEQTPSIEKMRQVYHKAMALGAYYVKIVPFVNASVDNKAILSLYSDCKNLIAFGMGDQGSISRIASIYCGATFTYVSHSMEAIVAPGQLSLAEMKRIHQEMDSIGLKKTFYPDQEEIDHIINRINAFANENHNSTFSI